ncbi:MAG: histidine phosphatase family protein, partial [Pseudomonadota bacterium]
WEDVGLRDRDRPLARRGIHAAPLMGQYMRAHRYIPDLILCSDAVRARQTLELLAPALRTQDRPEPQIKLNPGIYDDGADELLNLVRTHTDDDGTVLIIGHNPTLEDAADVLCGTQDDANARALRTKFPTAALAVFHVQGEWSAMSSDTTRLLDFTVPRSLGSGSTERLDTAEAAE